jgi:oligoendopeptidase F
MDWNLNPLFAGDNDPRMGKKRKILERESYAFINAWKDRTDYLEDPVALRHALDHYESWQRRYGADGDEGYYFLLRTHQDQNDPKLKARFNKIEEFSRKVENDSQFFRLRIAGIKREGQTKFLHHDALKPIGIS